MRNDQQVCKKDIFAIKHRISHEIDGHQYEDDPSTLNPSSTARDGLAETISWCLKTLSAEEGTVRHWTTTTDTRRRLGFRLLLESDTTGLAVNKGDVKVEEK
ncbi:hypothetical protein L1887_10620 [Cichorium endivia]|nr:hypothetical protein L1887_10620 [Cichorium endivia]